MRSFGSAQTNGLPFKITTGISLATRQLLHTAPAGAATPHIVRIRAINTDVVPRTLYVEIEDAGATVRTEIVELLPLQSGLFTPFSNGSDASQDVGIALNGSSTIKVWADAANVVYVTADVDDQSSVAGAVSQNVASGLIAAVQNANRFGLSVQGGTGTETEANAQLMISRSGTIRNLAAKVDSAVGGGATLTVTVRKNGASTAQILTLANADGTALKATTGGAITVVAGDLITVLVACDNAGAPAANVQAAFEFV